MEMLYIYFVNGIRRGKRKKMMKIWGFFLRNDLSQGGATMRIHCPANIYTWGTSRLRHHQGPVMGTNTKKPPTGCYKI